MAITFLEKRKKQRYLVLALGFIVLVILFVFWQGFFKKEEIPFPEVTVVKPQKVEINWEALKNEKVGSLQIFPEITPLEGEIGRENPFVPY